MYNIMSQKKSHRNKKNTRGSIGIAVILGLSMSMSLLGCGGPKAVENYPGKEEAPVTEEKQEEIQAVYEGNQVSYRVAGKGCELKVNAEVEGDMSVDYPIFTYQNLEMKEADLINVENFLLGRLNTNVIMPPELADAEYVASRQELLTKRMDQYAEKGETVPACVEEEMKLLDQLLKEDRFNEHYTTADPGRVCFTDLKDYYKQEYNEDVDAVFSFSEAVADEMGIIRFDVIKYNGNLIIHMYRQDERLNQAPKYELAANESDLPVKFDHIDRDAKEAEAKTMLSRIGFDLFECCGTYPAYVYGAKDAAGNPAYEHAAYYYFYSPNMNGKLRPCTQYTDYYTGSDSTTFPKVNSENVCSIFASGAEEIMDVDFATTAYDSLGICMDEQGLVEAYLINPAGFGAIVENKPTIMNFPDADGYAQNYFKSLMAHRTENLEIDHVSLTYCRTVEEDHFAAVPAWVYFEAGDSILPKPIIGVNAVTGDLIDIARGGVVMTE